MKKIEILAVLLLVVTLSVSTVFAARVVREGEKIYIVDRTGEQWDVTQAKKMGFKPENFQYGIGGDAFVPLQDEAFSATQPTGFFDTRVIGVAVGDEAHAYAVSRLRYHEIANTTLAGEAIVAGY